MKDKIKSHLGEERWAKLEKQAVEQGRKINALVEVAVLQATAKHKDDEPAAVAFAANRVLIGCNSAPSAEDIRRYEVAARIAPTVITPTADETETGKGTKNKKSAQE